MKYTFLFPYKNRVDQFYNTLLSLWHWYGRRDDWEIVVIMDGLEERVVIPEYPFKIRTVSITRDGVNPAPLFNMAARMACGEYVVITNPECYHVSNVLGWFDTVFATAPTAYAVAACDAVGRVPRLTAYAQNLGVAKAIYQHSTEHNVLYHFCSSMRKDRWDWLGGFDERFGAGYACEDDDFRDRVVCNGFMCVTDDNIKVIHQEHEKCPHTPELSRRYQHNLMLLRAGEAARGYKHDVNKFKVR